MRASPGGEVDAPGDAAAVPADEAAPAGAAPADVGGGAEAVAADEAAAAGGDATSATAGLPGPHVSP